jgi:hypothetical protein
LKETYNAGAVPIHTDVDDVPASSVAMNTDGDDDV